MRFTTKFLLTANDPDSNGMLDPSGHDVDRPHSLCGSDVGNPRVTNASLFMGSTWNPYDGSTPVWMSVPRQANVYFFRCKHFIYYYFLSLELL